MTVMQGHETVSSDVRIRRRGGGGEVMEAPHDSVDPSPPDNFFAMASMLLALVTFVLGILPCFVIGWAYYIGSVGIVLGFVGMVVAGAKDGDDSWKCFRGMVCCGLAMVFAWLFLRAWTMFAIV
jgi:hypothetical protein